MCGDVELETKKEKATAPKDSEVDLDSIFDHSGHRQRLKTYYAENGMDAMRDYEILELLLFYAIPRKDTRVIARRLLNRFGSLAAALDAPITDLTGVKGVGENTALLLHMLPDLTRAYLLSKQEEKPHLKSLDTMRDYLASYFVGRDVECFYLLCLDNAGRPLRCIKLAQGDTDAVIVNLKKVGLEIAGSGATGIVVAHNHPKGEAFPSQKDVEVTEKIANLARQFNVRLYDHIIFSADDSFSMAQSNRFYARFFID